MVLIKVAPSRMKRMLTIAVILTPPALLWALTLIVSLVRQPSTVGMFMCFVSGSLWTLILAYYLTMFSQSHWLGLSYTVTTDEIIETNLSGFSRSKKWRDLVSVRENHPSIQLVFADGDVMYIWDGGTNIFFGPLKRYIMEASGRQEVSNNPDSHSDVK